MTQTGIDQSGFIAALEKLGIGIAVGITKRIAGPIIQPATRPTWSNLAQQYLLPNGDELLCTSNGHVLLQDSNGKRVAEEINVFDEAARNRMLEVTRKRIDS